MDINTAPPPKFASDFYAEPESERPQFLKILCILSFVASGLLLLIYAIGTLSLRMNEEIIGTFWNEVIKVQPVLENVDPIIFFHEFGMLCIYSLILNIISLIGIIMMWRLNKIGFYIYVLAEITANFFSLNLNTGEQNQAYSGLVFPILIDLIFIGLYFMNLKHMNKNKTQINH